MSNPNCVQRRDAAACVSKESGRNEHDRNRHWSEKNDGYLSRPAGAYHLAGALAHVQGATRRSFQQNKRLQELTDRLLRHRAAQRLRELPQRGNRNQNLRHGTFQAPEIFAALRDPGSPESQSEDAQKDKEPKFDKTFMILIYLKKIQIFKFKKFQTLLRT